MFWGISGSSLFLKAIRNSSGGQKEYFKKYYTYVWEQPCSLAGENVLKTLDVVYKSSYKEYF